MKRPEASKRPRPTSQTSVQRLTSRYLNRVPLHGWRVGEFGLALGRPVARSIVWPLRVLQVFRVFVCVLVSATPAEVTVT